MLGSGKQENVNRRKLLQGLSAATIAGLAGCSAEGEDPDGGGDQQSLGEAVPPLKIHYVTGWGNNTDFMEKAIPVMQDNFSQLGLEVELIGRDLGASGVFWDNDTRLAHLTMVAHGSSIKRLDSSDRMDSYHILPAGANQLNGKMNIADCEITGRIECIRRTVDIEEQLRLKHKAWQKIAEAKSTLNLSPMITMGAWDTDQVEIDSVGNFGLSRMNPWVWIRSRAIGDTSEIRTNAPPLLFESVNPWLVDDAQTRPIPHSLLHSTLISRDPDTLELIGALAELPEVENDNQRVIFELRDTQFHNGDPVTSEEVKYTWEITYANQAITELPKAPLDSIEIVDDRTIAFNLTEPYPLLVTTLLPQIPILHKPTFEEANAFENFAEFNPSTIIGSGPYQLETYTPGQLLVFEPFDGTPFETPQSRLIFRSYRGAQAVVRDFMQGNINVANQISAAGYDQVQDQMSNAETVITQGFTPQVCYMQTNWGPTKFLEFRDALGKALDRQLLLEVATQGRGEPQYQSTNVTTTHPEFPDEIATYTDNPRGDLEGARQVLRDNGWGWDSDGRLHYPADADTAPLWPQGSGPWEMDEYPCITEAGGEYVGDPICE